LRQRKAVFGGRDQVLSLLTIWANRPHYPFDGGNPDA
jgi:hypothetical protein